MNKLTNWFKRLFFRIRLSRKPKKTLYIIGNGFDIHHGLDTWYSSFGLFLQENYSKIYDSLVKYIGMPELDRDESTSLYVQEWNEFEKSLANLFFDEIMDEFSEYTAEISSDDYYKDLNTIEIYVSEIRDDLTLNLFRKFKEYILQIEYPIMDSKMELIINLQARYFNFNYTKSLQEYYGIQDSHIKYIHNHAASEDTLILGHGFAPEEFKPIEPKPPQNATDEELQEWHDHMGELYDISFENGKSALLKYFTKSFKNSEKIIESNQDYFKSLFDIEKIVVFGHSLSSVDEKYFQTIISSINSKCTWFVPFRDESEMNLKKERLVQIGIKREKIKPIDINWLIK